MRLDGYGVDVAEHRGCCGLRRTDAASPCSEEKVKACEAVCLRELGQQASRKCNEILPQKSGAK
jgi:hypothetical protein